MSKQIKSAAGIRESRKWWAVEDTGVRQVTGYICSPDNRDMWWCPQAGYTLTVGHHLFETEQEALQKAIKETEFEISEAQKHLKKTQASKTHSPNSSLTSLRGSGGVAATSEKSEAPHQLLEVITNHRCC